MLIQIITLVFFVLVVVGVMVFLILEIVHTTNENTKRRNQEKALRANNKAYSQAVKKRY